MFTGIIEELGKVAAIEPKKTGIRLQIAANCTLEDIQIGDSIAVNGCCLTVAEQKQGLWSCDVVSETMDKTTFKSLKVSDAVNLERAVQANQRLGGHLVQGHVDGIGTIIEKRLLEDGSFWVTIKAPASILHYVIYKGSIAVDGVSLTVADVTPSAFSFAMIPHTAQMTTLGIKPINATVNLEIDLIAKYVEKLIIPFKQ